MEQEIGPDQTDEKRFRLSFSLDREGYFRHECGSCGRHFKTRPTQDQLVSAIEPAFREVDLEIASPSASPGESEGASILECPYCGYRAALSEMLTQSFADYLRRFIFSEYLEPQVHRMLDEFSGSFGGSGGKPRGGLFSIEVTTQYSRGVRSTRPISGPDAPDMSEVRFLCCQESMKVESPFKHISSCPFCHEEVALF